MFNLKNITIVKIYLEFKKILHLKVHKRENFLGSDIEICTFS